MDPSSPRPDALVRHLRAWGFLTRDQSETAGLLSPPDTRARVYSKCRGTWAQRLTSAGLLQLHSEVPTLWFLTVHSCWGVSGSFCLDYSTLSCFPTYLLLNAAVGRKALKAKHCSCGPAHTFISEHGRPGSAIPDLNLVPVEQSRTGNQIEIFQILHRCVWAATRVRTQVGVEHSSRLQHPQMGIQPCYSRLIYRLDCWHCLPPAHLLEWHFAHSMVTCQVSFEVGVF